jgi:ABC-2 type transport system permease protein
VTLAFARYDGRRRLRGAAALAAGLSALTALYVAIYPSITEGIDLDEYVRSLPPALREAFGLASLNTVEGYLAAELYAFGWVILLGTYLAYAAAGTVAGDVESGRMDVLLSLPVTRSRLLVEKFAALSVPIVVVNAVVPVVVAAGVIAIGESIAPVDLAMVHLLSVPYLLATAAVGLLASVVLDRASTAQRAGAGLVFALFLVESVVTGTDLAPLGAVSPTRYYDPTAVLVRSEYDLAGAAVLLVAAAVLVAASRAHFRRVDVT